MNALAELQRRARPVATSATTARQQAQVSQLSQLSQGGACEKRAATLPLRPELQGARLHLLALAEAADLPAALVHRLHDLDLAACDGLDDPQLRAFLRQLRDTAMRHAGERPPEDTATILCAHCGPVWAHPTLAAALPVVGGWPRALGCPWCFVRKAGGTFPHPPVACDGCARFASDAINPRAGMGTCTAGQRMHYPTQRHACAAFTPDKEPSA